jgi:hypothetical protein
MVNLGAALYQLRLQRKTGGQELRKLDEAISMLESLNGARSASAAPGRIGKSKIHLNR